MTGPIEVPPTPVTMCTYVQFCPNRAVGHVWEQTRPGLLVEDDVCPTHLRSALALGYRQGYPPQVEDRPPTES